MEESTRYMNKSQGENSLQDFLVVLWKRKFGMTVIFCSVVGLVTIFTFLQTPIFEIDSTLMVKYGREYMYSPVDRIDSGDVQPFLTYDSEETINTLLEILRSKELMLSVVNEIGVGKLYPALLENDVEEKSVVPIATARLKKKLTASHVKGSSVIAITFQHENPEVAVETIQLFIERFKERHLQLFKNSQTEFLEKQVAKYSKKLKQAEDELKVLKQENNIYDIETQHRFLIEQLVNVKTEFIKGKSRSVELAEMIASLKKQMSKSDEEVVLYGESAQEKNINHARTKLLDLKLLERNIMEKYTDNSRPLKSVRKEIKLVEDFLAVTDANVKENIRTGKNVVYQKLEKDLATATVDYDSQLAKNKVMEKEVGQLEKRLRDLSGSEIELKRLSLLVETTGENYKNFVVKLEENRIQETMDNQKLINIVVVQEPMVPIKPIKPRKKLNIIIGIILGIAAALVYALFFGYVVGQVKLARKQ